ncbi:MAG: Ivy family c-type lysozyme inhibitor [Pigmentiphaga sp.]
MRAPVFRLLSAGLAAFAVGAAAHAADPKPAALGADMHMGEAARALPGLASSFQALMAPLTDTAPWLKNYGTTMPSSTTTLDGKDYVVFQACKPHDCISQGYAVLVDPDNNTVVGGAFVDSTFDGPRITESKITWFGQVEWDQAVLLGQHLY